jgi:hypothetical protein
MKKKRSSRYEYESSRLLAFTCRVFKLSQPQRSTIILVHAKEVIPGSAIVRFIFF